MFSKTSIQNLSDAWWPKPTAPSSPLASLHTAVDCLQRGVPIPEPAASVLLDGLLRVMAGSKFEQALGLDRGAAGKPSPTQTAAQDWRDSQIKALAELLPGDCCKAKAEACRDLLHAPRQPGRFISEAEAIADELRLRQRYGLDLPQSVRQFQRLIGGK